MARRAFLRGQSPCGIAPPYRPPWAVGEALFTCLCTRCGACIAACPTGLLTQGAGGFPEADFRRGHCTFCADCIHACTENTRQGAPRQSPALVFSSDLPPWTLQAIIGTDCLTHKGVSCRSCEDRCEAGAIRFTPRTGCPAQPGIIISHCVSCGECVAACPTHAISMQNLPPPARHPDSFPEKSPQ
ncbi:MAG: ferredoxin-type protein NapF [Azoarcus sp.]|nr:ferredoxin-type protein NapF [Azoarcus sp.]